MAQGTGQCGSFGTGHRSVGVIWYRAQVSGGHLVQGIDQWGSFGTGQRSVGVIWYRAQFSGVIHTHDTHAHTPMVFFTPHI